MACRTIIVLTDDLDASTDGVTTHHLALDSTTWEIDLSAANLARLRAVLSPFTRSGRRQPAARTRRAARPSAGATGRTTAPVQRWWLDNRQRDGIPPFASRGQIPDVVHQAYRAAH